MKIVRKDHIKSPFVSSRGETIYEMIGRTDSLGGAKAHSLGHVAVSLGGSSRLHYHPVAEETYYILAGQARMLVDANEFELVPGDAVLIMPGERHQIFSRGKGDLEFIVICAPAWEENNSVYLDKD